jgi:hypothetical protein
LHHPHTCAYQVVRQIGGACEVVGDTTQQQAHGLAMGLVQAGHSVGAQAEGGVLGQPRAGLAKSVCIGGEESELKLVKHTE